MPAVDGDGHRGATGRARPGRLRGTGRASRLLAVEIARRDRGAGGLTARKPWLAAFTFGLLHGFGFAGALAQIGLPTGDVPLALLAFNLGVEAGRIAFIAAATALLRATQALRVRPRPWMRAVPACTIGSFTSFWFLQRCAALFG